MNTLVGIFQIIATFRIIGLATRTDRNVEIASPLNSPRAQLLAPGIAVLDGHLLYVPKAMRTVP